ncbi:hypothetical protein C2U71_07780 [Burkholderia ubonensis]|nr:hypothetical protein C2U71_07780 [Burkholderia ubonensis]
MAKFQSGTIDDFIGAQVGATRLSPPQIIFRLDEERFWQFIALLDASQDANPGFERLMSIRAPWDTGAT